jgi:(2Fe-2S) ferredoxin
MCSPDAHHKPALQVADVHALLSGNGHASAALHDARLAELRRDVVQRPTIFVGAGTCGLGAGAGKTLAAIRTYVADQQLEADLVEVGCVGLCAVEPLVDIQLPGKTRVSFKSVTEKKVAPLLDAVFAGNVPTEQTLGQFRHDTLQPWPDVPFIDEHPFFKPQTRWVLANCGLIDPGSIDEYLARGGYQALAKTLRETTPPELCDAVERAGLRGRGGGGFPTGKKWKFALNTAAEQKYLVCNADEGDPGAFMDRAVIEGDPHRLIEVWRSQHTQSALPRPTCIMRAEYPLAIERLGRPSNQAKSYGLLGDDILGSGYRSGNEDQEGRRRIRMRRRNRTSAFN